VLPCGRFTSREYMGDGVGVALGIELLIFVLKATRVLALVTHSALVWFRILFG
jgi:hypothetical protein